MGFVGEVMKNNGIQWYYIVGLLIFIAIFAVIVYKTFKLSKKDINSYKQSILDGDDAESKKY